VSIFIFGDLHFPWASKPAINWALKDLKKHKPKVVVQIGDIYDMFSFGRFAGTKNLMTPKAELEAGRKDGEEFWKAVKRIVPKADCFQLKGNHDERIFKKMFDRFPEIESAFNINHIWEFPKVRTVRHEREELFIDDVCFIHGYRSRLGDHCRFNHCKTVVGHSHRGGVFYLPIKNKTIWELNVGFLADRFSTPMSYSKQRQISAWTLGYGIIDDYGPRFIPK
jgi:predicted phosphodiesterase